MNRTPNLTLAEAGRRDEWGRIALGLLACPCDNAEWMIGTRRFPTVRTWLLTTGLLMDELCLGSHHCRLNSSRTVLLTESVARIIVRNSQQGREIY